MKKMIERWKFARSDRSGELPEKWRSRYEEYAKAWGFKSANKLLLLTMIKELKNIGELP